MSDIENSADLDHLAARLRSALASPDLDAFAALLDANVRWGGEDETETHSFASCVGACISLGFEEGVQLPLSATAPHHSS